jgi:high-affinity nickel-transport protein
MLVALGAYTLAKPGAATSVSLKRPVAVGLVHGLAGSAFVALLVLAAIPGWVNQLVYLALFGIGTIAGMAAITAGIALPVAASAERFGRMREGLRFASGFASVALGLFLAHRIGVTDGLFAATPLWTPR